MFIVDKSLKVLAISAHPDDIELSCGGSLLKLKKEYSAKIYTIICSKGELKNDPKIRVNEQNRASKFLEVTKTIFLDKEDGFISADSDLVSQIEEYLRKWKPDIVFTHCVDDVHQDHRNVGWATLSATRRLRPAILLYPSLFTRDRFTPNLFIDISKYFQQKIKLLKIFKSQASNEYMSAEVIKAQAGDSGLHSGCRYAEEFSMNFWAF